jgi:5-methylcytosine-specific restriction endonuclease McrA
MAVHCPCVKYHSPAPAYLQRHHILPLSWGGKTELGNLVEICGTTHDAVHDILNAYVRAEQGKGQYPWRTPYPVYARALAKRAIVQWYEKHDGDTPPTVLTSSHPT